MQADVPDDIVSCCGSCRHWSEDDDEDGRGSCAVLLNDPVARGWRPRSQDGCSTDWAWDGRAQFLPLAIDAFFNPNPPPWLRGAPWRWEVQNVHGVLLADGEGCRTSAIAIEAGRVCCYQEGWLPEP